MSSKAINKLSPWEDRWKQPESDVLLSAFEDHPRKVLQTLIDQIEAFEGIARTLVWYGDSWKWCWQFDLESPNNSEARIFGYLVPNPETPLLCITLDEELVAQLPMRRLHRFIREGIRQSQAKCAVKIFWATWSPTAMTETEQLMDLVKRKYKLLTQPKKK